MQTEIDLKVIRGNNFHNKLTEEGEIPYLIGFISAADLIFNYEIPYSDTIDGYQRAPGTSRINKFATKIARQNVDFPTLVLLNIRDNKAINHLKGSNFKYIPDVHGSLYVMDGQHRILAISKAFEDAKEKDDKNVLHKIAELEIPFGLTITQDVLNEMVIFDDVNTNAKGISANLRSQINAMRIQRGDQKLFEEMKMDGTNWKLSADAILREVAEDPDSVWFKRIKYENLKNLRQPNVGNFAMEKYLSNILLSNEAKMSGKDYKFSQKVFNAYWKGFELACPEVFESAKDYSIQTAMGADVFMRLWNFMKDWIRNNQSQNNQNLTDPNTYVPAFKKIIQNSEGIDRNGEVTKGIDYWKKGGAAGAQGSGEAGKTTLASNLEEWLTASE